MKLISIDLEAPLPTIAAASVGEQWVLVRFHRHPLGILHLAPRRSYTPQELGELAVERCSWELRQHLLADGLHAGGIRPALTDLPLNCPRRGAVSLPHVTVAVCTRNGANHLSECLDSLAALEYPSHLLDLLVVDNASADDATERLIRDRYPRIRCVPEPRPGLDWARNRALMESRAEIVAYTDDDVSVDSAWVEAIVRAFEEEPAAMAVTGLVVADEIDVEPQRLFEKYGGFSRGFKRGYYRVDLASGEAAARRHGGAGHFGTGANMAFRRSLFETIGLFDPALDVGTATNGGGDLEMFFRVLKHGHMLVYEPSAIVRHRHRRAYSQLKTQITNNGIGFYAYLVRSGSAYPDERAAFVRLGLWWFWWWNVRRLLASFVDPAAFPRDLILAELRGCFTGVRRYAQARVRAEEIVRTFGQQRPMGAPAS